MVDEKERAFEQRAVETSRARVAARDPHDVSTVEEDDVDTDRSLNAVRPVSVEIDLEPEVEVEPARRSVPRGQSFGDDDEVTPCEEDFAGEPSFESPWKLNSLAIALLAAFLCTLMVAVALRIKLAQTRAALAEAESAAAEAESAIAREPAETEEVKAEKREIVGTPTILPRKPEAAARAAEVAPAAGTAPDPSPAHEAEPSAQAQPAPAKDQLILLLTVGKQPYAEKQLRALKHRCDAPLAVYRQTRGRCAYDQCFAIAVPLADADQAKACGRVAGQSIRDRADFAIP